MLLLTLWSAPSVAADDCAEPVAAARLGAQLDVAEAAYADLDAAAFEAAMDNVGLLLPCLSEVVPPELAARTHRTQALAQWSAGLRDKARDSLGALVRLQPEAALPLELVPEGHALHDELASAPAGGTETLLAPEAGGLWFDGIEGLERPVLTPSLTQWQEGDVVRWTRLARPGDGLPDYGAVGPPEPVVAPDGRRRLPLSKLLWASAAVSAVGATGTYIGAWGANRAFHSYEPSPGVTGPQAIAALQKRQSAAAVLTLTSAGLGLVAAGSAAGAWVLQ